MITASYSRCPRCSAGLAALCLPGLRLAAAVRRERCQAGTHRLRQHAATPSPCRHGISAKSTPAFFVGNSFFNRNWVIAPASVAARDGLGPLFNARSCSGCHFKDGRGRPPDAGEPMVTMLLRLSVPGTDARRPEARAGLRRADSRPGDPGVAARSRRARRVRGGAGTYADGEAIQLRRRPIASTTWPTDRSHADC